ncbi:MAG: DUF2088 domain-containing protein [Thalassovita sp.]
MAYPLPALTPVDQHFERKQLADISHSIKAGMNRVDLSDLKGKSVAITVGSRGIVGIVDITRAIVTQLQERGALPFIVPSMGSHGGATAQGQIEILAGYGVTETSVGAPIHASMDVVQVDQLDDGTPLYIDRLAYEADGIVIANKIKPHADFKGRYESGLVKMLCIGLGKHKGAVALHDHGFGKFHEILPQAAEKLLAKLPVLFGVGILENAFDDLMDIEVIAKPDILRREKELLEVAKASIGRLLFPQIDVLIVDEIGKNISGEGMDPNVTGRPGSGLAGFPAPDIQKIVALSVTPESKGNGVGIGSADISTKRCIESIDLGKMYTNAITATILNPAKLPMILNSDRDAITVALKTCNRITPETARIVRIKNTLEVHRVEISPALLPIVEASPRLSLAGEPAAMPFDAHGNLS